MSRDDTFPEWRDSITVLSALGGKRMAKTVMRDGSFIDYDDAYYYNGRTVYLTGLDDVWELLHELLPLHDTCVVRGALASGDTAHKIRRLLHPDAEKGDTPTLVSVARRWLALDVDGVERPEQIPPSDLLACADEAIERLPRPFWRAQCIVQASAGHGLKAGCRLRLWFWCDRPMTGGELKRWLHGSPADLSVFRDAQPIYSASPVFAHGAKDHLPHRLARYPGEQWLQCPTEAELAPPARPAPATVQPVAVAGSARAALYVQGAVNSAAQRIRNADLRHPAILQEACGLARFVHAGLLTESAMHGALWQAASAAGKDDQAEIARMVAFGLAHPSGSEIPVEVRHG